MIQTRGVNHVVLHGNDLQRSKSFYTEMLGMTAYREDDGQVFLQVGQEGDALFKERGNAPVATGSDLNHLMLHVFGGIYDPLKTELGKHEVVVNCRPGQDHCFYFFHPAGRPLPLMVR